jgi:hypothetical protein
MDTNTTTINLGKVSVSVTGHYEPRWGEAIFSITVEDDTKRILDLEGWHQRHDYLDWPAAWKVLSALGVYGADTHEAILLAALPPRP